MPSPSNLYAEKIFSEQPIALWALDDKVDFVSLMDNNDKAMSEWTISGSASFLNNITQSPQVVDSSIVGISVEDDLEVTLTSDTIVNSSDLDRSKNTFTLSTYIKADADATVKLGYSIGGVPVTETFEYTPQTDQGWAFLSKAFDIPEEGNDISIYMSIQQSIDIETVFYFNNLSMGQWSESNATVSSGVVPQLLSDYESTTLSSSVYCFPANAYGLSENSGYYLASANKLFAYNDGFPMVYGASNITKILPNGTLPSLIIPGNGFLNESGKYLDLTVEMWLRINPNQAQPSRIFGPIGSSDGLYVNGEFLTIKVGDSYGSHFVGTWGRPMLVNFRVSENTSSLLIDGDQVISMSVDTESLELPKPFDGNGKSQDWLGFYSHSHIDVFELDCVAIYGYQIPEIVAKRRFVYGQGVEFPELSSSLLIGASTFIDYKVADYAKNYIYPDMGRWGQGILDNALVDGGTLKTRNQVLPSTTFGNDSITEKQWLSLCSQYSEDAYGSVDLTLANSLAGTGGYMFFEEIGTLAADIKGFYGVFKTSVADEQILFKIVNSVNNNTFTAKLVLGKITYVLSDGFAEPITIESAEEITTNQIFAAGVNIVKLSKKYGGRVSRFFGSLGNLTMYLGGQEDLSQTFNGRIYRFGFSTQRNLDKLEGSFETDGDVMFVLSEPEAEQIISHTSSYTLKPMQYISDFVLEVASNLYWQDYVPLSYMAGSVLTAENSYEKNLQFIQFNLNSPAITSLADEKIDVSNSQVKSYITFQYIQSKPNADHTGFLYTEQLSDSKVIYPGANWRLTRYEVVDETVVYLPSDADYKDLAVVMHLEITAQSSLREQIKVKSLELASQALSNVEPTEIPTRFGDKLYGYTLRGIYPDYSSKNPISIYKGSTPYLYLTNNSGIKMNGILKDSSSRVIRSRVNEQRSDLYRVGAVQVLSKYYEDYFPETAKKLMTFTAQNKTVSLYVKSSNAENTRGLVYALDDKTGLPDQTIYFYANGKLVKDLYLEAKTWAMLGIQFQESLDFNSAVGYIDISGPLLVHGISNYRLTSTQDSTTSILRNWSQVRTMIGNEITYWGDFLDPNPITTWENVLYIPTLRTYVVDPRLAFNLYTGTNKIIVGDTNRLRFSKYEYRAYNDIVWQSDILDAV